MRRLSARPHHVGSPYDKDNAEWILAHFKEWGLDAHIERFDVLFPTPKVRVLEMLAPTKFTAKLEEPALAVDPTSNQKAEQLPTYNAYSIDGDVTGPLVFVNYGLPEDYEKLDRLGISVKGAIVIAKYYHSWRGVKPKVAAEHGAIGCLIYSEPQDDGYTRDNVFPLGPMRNPDGVQRGSVMDFASVSPGGSADARDWRDTRCQAPVAEGGEEHHENSGAPDFLRRRAAFAGRAGGADGAGRVARLASNSVSRGTGTGTGSFEGRIELGHQEDLRCNCENSGQRGSGRVDRARQSS
jgi:hypothetical protein